MLSFTLSCGHLEFKILTVKFDYSKEYVKIRQITMLAPKELEKFFI